MADYLNLPELVAVPADACKCNVCGKAATRVTYEFRVHHGTHEQYKRWFFHCDVHGKKPGAGLIASEEVIIHEVEVIQGGGRYRHGVEPMCSPVDLGSIPSASTTNTRSDSMELNAKYTLEFDALTDEKAFFTVLTDGKNKSITEPSLSLDRGVWVDMGCPTVALVIVPMGHHANDLDDIKTAIDRAKQGG